MSVYNIYTLRISLTILIFLCFLSSCGAARTEEFLLLKVLDGDTILVKPKNCIDLDKCHAEKIRFIGIDAPEYSQEPWGIRSTQFLEDLLVYTNTDNNYVYLAYGIEKRDKYNRMLAYVYNKEGAFANKLLLENGFAEIFTYAKNREHLLDFKKAQAKAKKANLNIWDIHNGLKLRPYEYRRKNAKSKKK